MSVKRTVARVRSAPPGARQKFRNVVEDLVEIVAEIRQMVVARQFQQPGVRDTVREISAAFDIHHRILRAVDHQRRNAHVGQDSGDIDLAVDAHQRGDGGRARAGALSFRKPFAEHRIVGLGRRPGANV